MDFELEYSLVDDLCKCSNLLSSKEAYLGLICRAGNLHVFAYDLKSTVEFYIVIDSSLNFEVGVNLAKFVAVSKRLYVGNVSFTVKSNKLSIRQGNLVAYLPIMRDVQESSPHQELLPVVEEKVDWLIDSLIACNLSVVYSDKFSGVLIDQTSEHFVRVSKLSGVAITIITSKGTLVASGSKRYVVSSDTVAALQSHRDKIVQVSLNDNWIYFIFRNGVILRSVLLHDTFPSNYIESLGLLDVEQIIDRSHYNRYVFDRDEFYSAIDAVMIVADNKRTTVGIKMLGFEEETGLLAWGAKCRSSDGSVVEEKFKCSELVEEPKLSKFNVSGLDLANSLRVRGAVISLYNSDEKPVIVISDLKGEKVTMLIKSITAGE